MFEVSGHIGQKARTHSWDEAIGDLATRQHGVVSLAQLRELGLSYAAVAARVQRKRLVALHRCVYAVGHTALTIESHFSAAVYACGPGALLSHRCAGAHHGLLTWHPTRIDVLTAGRRSRRDGIVLHSSRVIHPDDRTDIDAIPTTSVARTLVDLADVLNERQLTQAIRRAELLKTFDLRALEAARDRLLGRKGRHRLSRVLVAYRPEPQLLRSEAERRVKQLCERHRLPLPQFNVNLHGHEVDVYWPQANLVLEVDGAETHHTRHAFHADRRRDRALAAHGVQTLRVTWPDLNAPLAHELSAILRRR